MKLAKLASCLLLCASAIFAQTALGTITGTVTDPSGASVANADITAKNVANGQVYRAVSTDTGNYTVPQVPVGSYSLTVTVKGFKGYTRDGLDLAAAQVMRIDVPLQVGSQSESVTVTAEASLLVTESGNITHNVTSTEMSELPIMSVGGTFQANTSGYRDPLAVSKLLPGIQYAANSQMVINGTPATNEQIRIEGQTSGGTSGLRLYTAMGQASSEAIQEVAVQTSNFAAEFGTAGGGIFNMTMKSGTNQVHGTVSDYFADDLLNSAQPYTGLKTQTKRHDYGISVGGPLWIPKVYDGRNKTFLFFNFEEFRENALIASIPAGNPTVPTAAYRSGDFSQVITGNGKNGAPLAFTIAGKPYVDPLGNSYPAGTIFDPTNFQTVNCAVLPGPVTPNCNLGSQYTVRLPFANNFISPALFDPVAVRILNLVPSAVGQAAAGGAVSGNFQNPFISQTRAKIPSVKGDQSIGSKAHVSFYGGATLMDAPYTVTNGNAEGFPSPITAARGSFIYTKTYRANYDYTLTPTLLLHVGAGWFQQEFNDTSPATTSYDASQAQTCTNTPDFNGLLAKTCTGGLGLTGARTIRQFPSIFVGSASAGTGGMSNLGPAGSIQSSSLERRPSGVANATWVKGNHNYKVGGEWRLERFPIQSWANTVGTYNFATAQSTGTGGTVQTALNGVSGITQNLGFPFASFVLGDVSTFTIAQPGASTTRKSQTALFIQDTWKVTRKFTVDYGLRWDYATYGHDENGILPNFSPTTLNPSAGDHPGAQIFEHTCGCKFASNYPYAIGPRVGLAYQINSKTVFRGGVGVVYNSTPPVGSSAGSNSASTPGLAYGGIAGQLVNGIPNTLVPVFPNLAANAGQVVGGVVGAPSYLDPNSDRPARQLQYSVSLQREFSRDLVVEASYVGNRGTWWSAGGLTALNAISQDLLTKAGFTIGNTTDSGLLTSQWGQLNNNQISSLAQRGVFLPYSNFPTNLANGVRQSILPFPQYSSAIAPANAPLGNTWYDALQTNVTKRLSHGVTFNANYTFAKTLDLMSSPDIFNRILGKNYAGSDLPHQFRLSAEYRTPRVRGGNSVLSNKVVSYILSDWAVGTYLQYQSAAILGRPPSSSPANAPLNNYLGRGPGSSQLNLDANGQPMNPFSVNWTDLNGVHHTDPLDINCKCFDPTTTQVLNPAAWTNVPDGQWANNFTNIRNYRGFRFPSENMNFGRTFRIKERVSVNIRVEFANAFNRLVLPQPNAGVNQGTALTTQATGTFAGAYTGGFGIVGGGFGAPVPFLGTSGYRTGLFVGRLTF